MSIPTNNSKFVSMLLVLLSLFIFVFFTKWYYSDLISNISIHDENKSIHSKQLAQMDILEKKQKELKKLDGSSNSKIWKYLQQFNEDEIIKEIYTYSTNYSKNGGMKIISINMGEWKKNELWFNESSINISARVENKAVMIDFLDFLIQDSKYKFYINSFNIPKNKDKFFNIQIPLVLFYKEIEQKKVEAKNEIQIEEKTESKIQTK